MEAVVKNATTGNLDKVISFFKSSYVVLLLSVLGIFALITAVLVAWPALAYFASLLV